MTTGGLPDEVYWEETMETYYFTFGYDHAHPKGYVVIEAVSWDAARDEMFAHFGRAWAFQYDESAWHKHGISMAEKYGLHEAALPEVAA